MEAALKTAASRSYTGVEGNFGGQRNRQIREETKQ